MNCPERINQGYLTIIPLEKAEAMMQKTSAPKQIETPIIEKRGSKARNSYLLYLTSITTVLLVGAVAYGAILLIQTRQDLLLQQVDSALMIKENDKQLKKMAEVLKFVLQTQEEATTQKTEKEIIPTDLDDPNLVPQPTINLGVVAAAKANLRKEPRLDSPILMVVANAAKLVIEGELGDWFKVTTPNGEQAWISKKIVDVSTAQG